jgi:hypothetical protein
VNAVDHHFYWFEDGELRVHFEPLFPTQRDGRDADDLEPVMQEVGFDHGAWWPRACRRPPESIAVCRVISRWQLDGDQPSHITAGD